MLIPSTFHSASITLATGVLHLLMAISVWRLLYRSAHNRVVRLWSLGSCVGGVGVVLQAGRDVLPDALSYPAATVLMGLSVVMHTQALRVFLDLRSQAWPMGLTWLATATLSPLLLLTPDLRLRAVFSCSVLLVACVVLALHSGLAGRQTKSSGGRVLAWTAWVVVLALALRIGMVAGGWTTVRGIYQGWDYAAMMGSLTLAGLYGNLGFMGLMLDSVRAAELRAHDVQLSETVRREAAEHSNLVLRSVMAQRDQLSAERERLLQLLAHEIRQPLHNASGALQAADQALRDTPAAGSSEVTQRLGRAATVLGDVRSVLDNTLAAASLLTRSPPLALQEVELVFLVNLVLGDLEAAERQRVQVQWQTDLREVEVEPGLLRLALRNLLVNAFRHGGAGVQVTLRIAEQTQPPALLLQVIDTGPGRAAGAAAAPEPGRGLGLQIVRQVMVLHGGNLQLDNVQPQGLRASLVLPLPAD